MLVSQHIVPSIL